MDIRKCRPPLKIVKTLERLSRRVLGIYFATLSRLLSLNYRCGAEQSHLQVFQVSNSQVRLEK